MTSAAATGRRFDPNPADFVTAFAIIDTVVTFLLLSTDAKPVAGAIFAAVGLTACLAATRARGHGVALVLAGALCLGAATNLAFIAGHPPHAPFHDSVLMTDAAASWLISGVDPYGHDYLRTLARTFYVPDAPVNFGLVHYVYPPMPILLAVPLRVLGIAGGPQIGFQGMYPLALAGLTAAAFWIGAKDRGRLAMVAAFALNPLLLVDANLYFLNDVFVVALMVATMAALRSRRAVATGALFALAISMKQDAVFLLPPLAVGGLRLLGPVGLRRAAVTAAVLCAVIWLPFLAWNPRAFVGDVVAFFYSPGISSYPIRGSGLAGMMLQLGLVPNRWAPFPSAALQLAVTLPLAVGWTVALNRRFTWSRVWTGVGIIAMSAFFLGRGFSANYFDFSVVFLSAGVLAFLVERDEMAVVSAVDSMPARIGVSGPHPHPRG